VGQSEEFVEHEQSAAQARPDAWWTQRGQQTWRGLDEGGDGADGLGVTFADGKPFNPRVALCLTELFPLAIPARNERLRHEPRHDTLYALQRSSADSKTSRRSSSGLPEHSRR